MKADASMQDVLERDENGDPTRIRVRVTVKDTYDFNKKTGDEKRSTKAETLTTIGRFLGGKEFEWQVSYDVEMVKDGNGNWVEDKVTEPQN
ncbi:hypothetical protein PVA45_06060 [Entomospira entomophila]|uniref:Uncharacterized protein n=1 Tax=Entomospira entomophila TaxID=2719988 RepID=A0A968GCF3_9SPIO|nr:hypothetical protein [Entomospira entomophilus]NIZ41063.1 hypothetical protein [Entomospira entomophilus]WDI35272.1 hypothetical protein PVA45_06060 [Entomospira entomophilus]